jgi:hypothetical protein
MLEKFAFLSAVVMLPFIPKGPIRGDRAYEPRLPSSMPVEGLGPFPEAVSLGSEDSPRLDLPLAAPTITRLNAIERGPNAIKPSRTRVPLPPANTGAFVDWLRHNNEFGEMSKRRLLTLYAEFCDSTFEPVSTGRLMRQLTECGIVKRRVAPKVINGKYHSPTVYRVLPVRLARAA